MPTTSTLPYEGMARRSLEQGTHYFAAIMATARQTPVMVTEDIYAGDGTRLAAAGARLDEELYARLLGHKLFKPLDLSLAAPQGVTPESLAADAARLCSEGDYLPQLSAHCKGALPPDAATLRTLVPAAMAFKLTVARERRPQLFRHLLLVALVGRYIALQRGFSGAEALRVMAAALFHDVGELYTDPDLVAPGHRVGERERRHIYAHPVIGYLLVKDLPGVDPAVAEAVLQHQERLDGSGYPQGLRAKRIAPLARLVAVADVCAAIAERLGSSGRLPTLMRLNRQKYDNDLLAVIHEGFVPRSAADAAIAGATIERLDATADLISRWDRFRAALARECGGTPPHELAFVFERMVALRVSLLQFGFDIDSLRFLTDVAADDARVAADIAAALDEVRWQLADLEHEIARRRETVAPVLSDRLNRFLDSWTQQLRAYPDATPADAADAAGPHGPETKAH